MSESPTTASHPDAHIADADKPVPAPATAEDKNGVSAFMLKVLNGIAVAVVVALAPTALLGQVFKALLPVFPQGIVIVHLVALAATTLPLLIGVFVAMQFKMNPIQTGSVAIAAICGSGIAQVDPAGGFHVHGTGLVINTGLTAALAVLLIRLIGTKLGSYTVLLMSLIVTVVVGGFGMVVSYPVVKVMTVWLGDAVNGAAQLQPIPMGMVLATVFCAVIVSPISTVGIATAIMMTGVSSGVANLGCTAAAFGLMAAGWRANGTAVSLLHVFCTPKIQMANMFARPKAYLPILVPAPIVGAIGGWLGISGTPISAGFGITALSGPIAALSAKGWGFTPTNIGIVIVVFIVIPVALAFVSRWVFQGVIGWSKPSDYALDFDH